MDPEMFLLNEEGGGGGNPIFFETLYGIPNPHSQLYALGSNISFISPLPCI